MWRSVWSGNRSARSGVRVPWRLARTPDGTELAFKLSSTGDVLTRHIDLTSRLCTLGEPRVGGPVRIAVPGQPLLGLATFSLP